MATWTGLLVLAFLMGCIHAEQQQMQELGLEDSTDLATEIKSLQKNVTDLWTYIYQLRQAIERHLTDLTRRQSRLESSLQHQTMHSGGHDDHHFGDHGSHSESGHRHEPLTSSGDHHGDHSTSDHHHHDDHSSSSHHHDDHGTPDQHHDEHGSDHHHGEHGSSDHHHDEHGSSDHHHDEHGSSDHHHHESHSTSGDHQHGGDQQSHHGDYHDGHHSSSESHTHDHRNHSDSDHDDHHHSHEHHDSHEKDGTAHGDHQRSHEHKDSHEKQDKVPDEQQSVEDIEKPFPVPVAHHTAGGLDKSEELNGKDPLNLLGGRGHHHHDHHHHGSHEDPPAQQSYETKVAIPKFSEYRQYTFATCDVQPNRVISPELQQEVKGQVSFWQKKSGGPLNIHVRLRGFSIGDHHGHQQLQQEEQTNQPTVQEEGHRHGFHVHEFADLSAGCQSTGAHYNPFSVNHGGPRSSERHVGDLGNIECDEHGVTNIVFPDTVASLTGQYSIVGRALVIHSDVDDYGLNKDDPESLRTGNAGTRIACCVIQKVEKLSLATFKSIKSATNYQN